MGKYERYKNRLEMFLSSERGRRILTFCYSWGAAVVIIGALFKIVHMPYANQILTIAMIFEAGVFILSGFERPGGDYQWEDVFPVLKSKNPLDRPDFSTGGGLQGDGTVDGTGMAGSGMTGGMVVLGGVPVEYSGSGEQIAGGGGGQRGAPYPVSSPTPEELVNTGMAAMGLNISEQDAEVLSESIKKLNSAAESISKMADLTEVTQSYIDQISTVSQNLEKFSEITGSLGEVSDSLINSCNVIAGKTEDGAADTPKSYVANMSKLNDNLSVLNNFYETQLTGVRTQMETIFHINAGLNRIRDLYDGSVVDSTTFRAENERMAQLLSQLNQVYSRLLQAMTVNTQGGGYQQPPYQGGYPPQAGGFR